MMPVVFPPTFARRSPVQIRVSPQGLSAPRFEGRGVKALGAGMLAAGSVGFVGGLGSLFLSPSNPPDNRSYQGPTLSESVLSAVQTEMKTQVEKGSKFDTVVSNLKSGAWRIITGNRSSDDSKNFKILRNAHLELEDHLLDAAKRLAALTDDARVKAGFQVATSATKVSRDEYYDALERVQTYQPEDKADGYVSKFFQDRRIAQHQADEKTLAENDRALLLKAYEVGLKGTPDVAHAQNLYNEMVEKLVAKYAPQDLEACREAGKILFERETEHLKNRDNENTDYAQQLQVVQKKREAVQERAVTMGEVGLALLALGGILARFDLKLPGKRPS